jgi:hypothetical protein
LTSCLLSELWYEPKSFCCCESAYDMCWVGVSPTLSQSINNNNDDNCNCKLLSKNTWRSLANIKRRIISWIFIENNNWTVKMIMTMMHTQTLIPNKKSRDSNENKTWKWVKDKQSPQYFYEYRNYRNIWKKLKAR